MSDVKNRNKYWVAINFQVIFEVVKIFYIALEYRQKSIAHG